MLDFFFYGTLLDDDVRAAVLGRPVALAPARVKGLRRVPAAGRPYPAVIPDARAELAGGLCRGVTAFGAARLAYFEGAEYEAVERLVLPEDAPPIGAWMFLPVSRSALRPLPGDWDVALWQRRHKAGCLRAARETMREATAAALREEVAGWQIRALRR